MKKWVLISILFVLLALAFIPDVAAQCSICTKTAQQLGEKPAKALNAGILYLAFAPLSIIGILAYRYWKSNKPD